MYSNTLKISEFIWHRCGPLKTSYVKTYIITKCLKKTSLLWALSCWGYFVVTWSTLCILTSINEWVKLEKKINYTQWPCVFIPTCDVFLSYCKWSFVVIITKFDTIFVTYQQEINNKLLCNTLLCRDTSNVLISWFHNCKFNHYHVFNQHINILSKRTHYFFIVFSKLQDTVRTEKN
jgi:hypothetical protein